MAHEIRVDDDDEWFVGEDKVLHLIIYADGSTDGAIKAGTALREDISGHTLLFSLRKDPEDVGALFSKVSTNASEMVFTDPVQGEAEVYIHRDDTKNLPGDWYWVAVERTDPGEDHVLIYGRALLQQAGKRQ